MKFYRVPFIFFFLIFFIHLSFAASIVPYSSLEIVFEKSESIVLAKAINNYEEDVNGLTVFRTDFETIVSLKGELAVESSFFIQAASYRKGDIGFSFSGDVQYTEGATYLFFQNKNRQGNWTPILLSYYTFEQIEKDGIKLLAPIQAEVKAYNFVGRIIEPLYVYEQNKLFRLLSNMKDGIENWDNEKVKSKFTKHELADFRMAPDYCTWIGSARWTTFDSGGSLDVIQFTNIDGIATNCSTAANALSTAISDINTAYNTDADIEVDLNNSGTNNTNLSCLNDRFGNPSASVTMLNTINVNEIGVAFNDPCDNLDHTSNGVLVSEYSCTNGGLLGRGGVSFSTSTTNSFNGMTFNTARGGYVVMNNSVDNCLCESSQSNTMLRALTHELTHALSIGHIESDAGVANMNPSCCSSITAIDLSCVEFTYVVDESLPVELAYFDAEKENNNSVRLKWATFTEVNNNMFTLERSFDGGYFEAIANIPGAGNSTEPIDYEYLDEATSLGTNYYRLSQTDYDGAVETFNVVAVEIEGERKISLAPNPTAGGQSKLLYYNKEDVQLQIGIYNIAGQLLRSINHESKKGMNRIDLNIGKLKKGLYIVHLREGPTALHSMKLTVL